MVLNAQTNFEETLVWKRLLCSHLEQEVIKIKYVTSTIIDLYEYQIILISCSRWPRSNRLYTSVSSRFVCELSTYHFRIYGHIYIYIYAYNKKSVSVCW